MLIHHYHKENHHLGDFTLQQKFWFISAHLRVCIPCYHVRHKSIQTSMGNLPFCRLQQIKVFYMTGVDYGILRSVTYIFVSSFA